MASSGTERTPPARSPSGSWANEHYPGTPHAKISRQVEEMTGAPPGSHHSRLARSKGTRTAAERAATANTPNRTNYMERPLNPPTPHAR
jgi:hypothetical protein